MIAPETEQPQNQATILVVDDEQTLRDTLEYNLRREGYRVVTAAEGAQALTLASEERPDLVILDVMLPGMNGLDVCRAIRKQQSVPIVSHLPYSSPSSHGSCP